MNIRKLMVILSIVPSMGSLVSDQLQAETDPYPFLEIPVISGSYSVNKHLRKINGFKSVDYLVRSEYPASEVLEFYDAKFAKMGWVSFSGGFVRMTREWGSFVDGTREGRHRVRQLMASWTNEELSLDAILILRYEKGGIQSQWGNELHVVCQIHPKWDPTRFNEFIERLDKSGQYAEFMELIVLYLMPNGEYNLDKAIAENPENEYLKEFRAIVDEMTRARDKAISK